MRIAARVLFLATLTSIVASAQVSTGTPPFSSIGGGPFDQINLGNMNVHFAVPILHKNGRGIPFIYNLTYDSSIWTPITSSGVTQWKPVTGWGWNINTAASSGYVTQDVTNTVIPGRPCNIGETTYSNYVYHDPFGRNHEFVTSTTTGTPVSTWVRVNPCSHLTTYSGYVSGVASDGSGYSISAQYTAWTVTARGGSVITGPTNNNSGAGVYTDANGNKITTNTSNQYFDTLSTSTPVLTVGGSGTPSSPNTFTYIAPSGSNASYTMNYEQYTASTNFGVSGINEYGPTSVPLVSSIELPDGTSYSFTYEETPGSCTPLGGTFSSYCVTGRIASVTLPAGGTITYSYTGGASGTGIYSDGSTGTLTRILSPSTSCSTGCWQYARSLQGSTSPGPGSAWTTTVTDPQNNMTVFNFVEDHLANSSTTVATYNLYETQRKTYQGSSTLLATRTTCYNGVYSGCATASQVNSPISQTDTYTQLPNGSTRLSEVFYNGAYPASGLVSDDKEYDYGVSMGSAPGTAHLVKETVINYAGLGNGIIDHPSSIVTDDWRSGSAVTVASVSYTYDGSSVTATSGTPQHVSISGSRGNLTTLAAQTNSSNTLYQTFSYYDSGNLNVATDVNGATTTYNYGSGSCGNSFVTSISEPLGLSRSMSWNCTGGVEISVTDENSQTVTTSYTDPDFWRPANTSDQENNETAIAYSGQTAAESALSFNSGNSIADIRVTADGFGRPILSQRLQGPGASNYDTSETDYNVVGLPSRSTMPFSASAGGTNSSAPGVSALYDALGRPTSVTDADGGTTTYTYTNNDVLITQGGTGAQSFKKQLEYDGLGRLSSVCEISTTLPGIGSCGQSTAQTGYWTEYTYDALGHLLTVTQNAQATSGQQTRSYSYDLIGRLTSEANPETGTTHYTYDVACATTPQSPGDLTGKVDNAGNTTCYYYDALHRLNGGGYNNVCRRYNYDLSVAPPSGITVANTKTRLLEAETDNCSGTVLTDEWFSYSPRGELADVYESTPHSGGYYHTSASYWPSGSLETLSGVPSVPTLYYGAGGGGLDGEGRYTQVSASASPNPVTNVSYSTSSTSNPLGALIGVTYGSSDSDGFGYDPNTGRPATYTFTVNGQSDAGSTQWNSNGTLASLSINDQVPGTADSQSCSFTYDDLGRSAGVNCGAIGAQSFSYDPFGNISKTANGVGLSFQPSSYNAANEPVVSGMSFDALGNTKTDNLGNSYTWDPSWGDMTSVGGVTVTYDALDQVVEQSSGSGYAEILWSPVGKVAIMSGSTLMKAFVGLPGGGTAVYASSGLAYYRHADWLGSSRLASTQARGLYSSTAYAPFGEQYATAGTADPSFTGQNSDTVSSLYDFTFRRFSPSQGRWISPDPAELASVNPAAPQTWNRYAYVGNNPLSYVDPSGLLEADPCAGPHCNNGDTNDPFDPTGSGSFWGSIISGDVFYEPVYGWIPYPGDGSISPPCGGCIIDAYWGITGYDFVGFYGSSSGSPYGSPSLGLAPSNQKPLTPQQKQCIANAQADHNTATSRAWSDANHTWWVDIRNATGGGAVGGCIAGAIGGEGVGCIPGGLIGGLGGFAFGVPGGLWDASNQLQTALGRANEDYQTAVQRCTQ